MDEIDSDGNGELDFGEFLKLLQMQKEGGAGGHMLGGLMSEIVA